MSQTKTRREPFTAYPNKYLDKIKPYLTGVQRDVCDLVIRKTRGWHRRSAAIPNSEFMRKTRKSERAIITAKKHLTEMGLLIVVKEGGGSQTGEYSLDLYYDTKPQEESAPEPAEESQETPAESQESTPEKASEPEKDTSLDSQETDQPGPAHSTDSIDSEDHSEMSKPDDAPESDSDTVSEAPTTELSAAVPTPDPGINIYNIKQTGAANAESDKAERKKATAVVCSRLKKWGFDVESSNYAFVGWAIKHYGIEVVNEKLSILKFQILRGVKLSNVFGWLRKALSHDYQYSHFDEQRIQAEAKAQKRHEYSQAWFDQQDKYRTQVQTEREDPEAQARIAAAQAAFWRMVNGEVVV